MPYFVYKISLATPVTLEYLDTKEKFVDARQLARALRAALEPETGQGIRLIFAQNMQEAEKLLSAPREERVVGED
jgi:hypothetical protein